MYPVPFIIFIILAIISGVSYLVLLFRLFQSEDFFTGLLAFVCSPYTIYWAWKNRDEYIKPILRIWAISFVLAMSVGVFFSHT
jgi:hypothetical protein